MHILCNTLPSVEDTNSAGNHFATLLSNEVETTYEQCTETADKGIVHSGVEIQLLTKHAQLITELEKEINDYPEHMCYSCVYIRESL